MAILNFGPPKEWNGSVDDTVGPVIDPAVWKEVIPMLEADRVQVVVVRVRSGGGCIQTTPQFHTLFKEGFKPRFRVVAWIEKALNTAAECALPINEWVFAPDDYWGGTTCNGWAHCSSSSPADPSLEVWIKTAQDAAKEGGRSELLGRSLVIMEPLSADTDDQSKQLRWRCDEKGRLVLNHAGMILGLSAADAMRFGLSRGIASTSDELAHVLGLVKYELCGKMASEHIDLSMRTLGTTMRQLSMNMLRFQEKMALVESKSPQGTAKQAHSTASSLLAHMESTCATHPAMAQSNCIQPSWFREQHERLDALARTNDVHAALNDVINVPPTPAPDPAPPQSPAPPRP